MLGDFEEALFYNKSKRKSTLELYYIAHLADQPEYVELSTSPETTLESDTSSPPPDHRNGSTEAEPNFDSESVEVPHTDRRHGVSIDDPQMSHRQNFPKPEVNTKRQVSVHSKNLFELLNDTLAD